MKRLGIFLSFLLLADPAFVHERRTAVVEAVARGGIAPGARIADFAAVLARRLGQEPLRFLIARGNRGYYLDLPRKGGRPWQDC